MKMVKLLARCVQMVGLLFALGGAGAQAEPGEDLTVSVFTFGPGDHPFFKFGHNAILVQPLGGQGLVYNFGTFAFDSPALIPKFLRGRFKYWLSVSGVEDTIASYAAANRSVLAQELDLTAAQKWALWQALRENARPENREYLYDYFYDNCSTRVRDVVDRVTQGKVHEVGRSAGEMTFRSHSLRMVSDLWPEYVGLYLGLGRGSDVPINLWEEAFLPERLASLLRMVQLPDVAGGKKLVKGEVWLHRAARPDKPAVPPPWGAYFFLVGILLGGAMLLLGRLGGKSTVARILLGGATSATGGVMGFFGLALVGVWAFTNHRAAHANANIMQLAPWGIALLGYGVGVALGRPGATRWARGIVFSAMLFSAAGIACKILPGANQDNWPILLLCLPAWAGLWLGLRALPRVQK